MEDNNKNKRDEGLIGGIILIAIGIIALMVTFFDVDIVWSELAKFWPVFLMIFGVSLMPIGKMLKSIIVILMIFASVMLYCNIVNADTNTQVSFYDNVDENVTCQEFSEPFNNKVETADVEINYGAGTLFLLSPVDYLVKATNSSNSITQDLSVVYGVNNAEISFGEEGNDITVNNNDDLKSNRFNIALNENPVYDFEINVGACDIDFDFSPYKVSEVEINSGACDIDIKLGDLCRDTKVVLATGVSQIKIGIPSTSGCRIECESALSVKNFKGFSKTSSGIYETSNYSSAKNNIEIEFEGAMSDFEVYRY